MTLNDLKDNVTSKFGKIEPAQSSDLSRANEQDDADLPRAGAVVPKSARRQADVKPPENIEEIIVNSQNEYDNTPPKVKKGFFETLFNRSDDTADTNVDSKFSNVDDVSYDDTPYIENEGTGPQSLVADRSKYKDADCPSVSIVNDLKQLHRFTPESSVIPKDKVSSIDMSLLDFICRKSDGKMYIDISLGFRGEIGPKGRLKSSERQSFSYPYFVAITSDSGEILSKKVNAISIVYAPERFESLEKIVIQDSMDIVDNISDMNILIGFQLSKSELSYNRNAVQ